MYGVKIAGIGIVLGRRNVTNQEKAAEMLKQRENVIAQGYALTPEQMKEWETDDEWIRQRTGIKCRPYAHPLETTSDYAAVACQQAWTDAYGDGMETPDFLILGTVSPDHFTTPATNVITTRKMKIPIQTGLADNRHLRRYVSMDVTQACTSFMSAFDIADSFIRSGKTDRGLVCGADLMTRVMSPNRRSTSVVLADGAGSLAVETTPLEETWIKKRSFFSGVDGGPDGKFEQYIMTHAGGAKHPTQSSDLDPRVDRQFIYMNGSEVLRHISRLAGNHIIPDALVYAGLTLADIDVLILLQANDRITNLVGKYLMEQCDDCIVLLVSRDHRAGVLPEHAPKDDFEKRTHTVLCYNSIDHTGNLTSASIPVGMYEARELGIITPGKRVMIVGYGGGFSWCSCIIEWGGAHLFNK